jgi:hypothetical protein
MAADAGTVEFRPVDDWFQEDRATTLLREKVRGPAAPPLEPIVQRWIRDIESGEYSRRNAEAYQRGTAAREAENGNP